MKMKRNLQKSGVACCVATIGAAAQWLILLVAMAIKYPNCVGAAWNENYIHIREVDVSMANAIDIFFLLAIVFAVGACLLKHVLIEKGYIRVKGERW